MAVRQRPRKAVKVGEGTGIVRNGKQVGTDLGQREITGCIDHRHRGFLRLVPLRIAGLALRTVVVVKGHDDHHISTGVELERAWGYGDQAAAEAANEAKA